MASRQNLEFEEYPDPSEKRVPFCPPGTLAVILRPASSADAPGQNETEIKQEVKEEPEPETTTSSDDIENSQSLVQPASFGAAGRSSVFVVCDGDGDGDGEAVIIKQEPVDEQSYPETATNYSPMEDPPKREPDSQNEPGVYKECNECGEEYSFCQNLTPSPKCDHKGCTHSTTQKGSTHSGEKLI